MDFNQKSIGYLLIGFSVILVILLIFVKINMDARGAFLCQAVSENSNLDMEECPAHQDNASWLIVSAFGITFIVLAAGIYLIFIPFKVEKHESKKIDMSKLNEEEKQVYNLLKTKDGSMYQSDLTKELEISKVKLTRILDKMEGKHVLERKRRGMTNIVILR